MKMRQDARKEVAIEPKSTNDEGGDGSATEPMLAPVQALGRDRTSADALGGRARAGSTAESVKSLREND